MIPGPVPKPGLAPDGGVCLFKPDPKRLGISRKFQFLPIAYPIFTFLIYTQECAGYKWVGSDMCITCSPIAGGVCWRQPFTEGGVSKVHCIRWGNVSDPAHLYIAHGRIQRSNVILNSRYCLVSEPNSLPCSVPCSSALVWIIPSHSLVCLLFFFGPL